MMEGTADVPHQITDAHLPEAASVCDTAIALDTALDMVDPQPTLVELLVRHVLLPRELLPQIEINSVVPPSRYRGVRGASYQKESGVNSIDRQRESALRQGQLDPVREAEGCGAGHEFLHSPQGYRSAPPYGRLSHEDPLPRSTRMELHTRVALIDTLLEEADQKMQALQHALAAQERAKDEIQHAGHDTPLS
jgi:hypothetical protein